MTAYDEFFQPDGQPREHVRPLLSFFEKHGGDGRAHLRQALGRRLREQEVSFNILGAPDGTERRWHLDEIPHLLSGCEFLSAEAGLKARAEILEGCLRDIYGPQNLLRNGILPPQIVYGNPHYFRTLHQVSPVGEHRLILYAADVIKDAAGNYNVHSDRTGAPAGSGYALENRIALGQVLSGPFQSLRVRKINRFFQMMRQSLENLSPDPNRLPRVVLLTPGVHDESSFEHGYLARYQGLELVEGRDLTVRGDEVFLKTLEGLKKVDVILRRLLDDWCDPLELREDSLLGVSGLVGAVRAGKIGMANPLGSMVVESPAFRAYLPQIASFLGVGAGALPSIETRYLGDAAHRNEVLAHPESWVFRPAFYDRRTPAIIVGELSQAERTSLLARLQREPEIFVAEKWPEASQVPLDFETGRKGSLSLRLFACRSSGGDWSVMPGGLGRIDDDHDGLFLSTNESRTSKDVWVPGQAETEEPTLPRMPVGPLEIRRGGIDVPSRLFDDVFWLGRYAERSYGMARIVRAGLESLVEDGLGISSKLCEAVLMALVEFQVLGPQTKKTAPFEGTLISAIFDEKRSGSIRSCMGSVHTLTTATRSRLSVDTWKVLRRASELFETPIEQASSAHGAIEHLDDLLVFLAAFRGNTGSNMVRGYSWIFLELGRRIEHAVIVLTLLKHVFKDGESTRLMEVLLRICDSQLTYRSRYLSHLQATPVVDLVMTDDTNPQSVLFQVRRLLSCVRDLPQERPFPLTRAEKRLITLETQLITADLSKACRGDAADLLEMAEEGIHLLWQVSDDLTRTYFTHAGRSRAVAPNPWVDVRSETGS